MKKNPRLLALVGLTAVTLVLTGCTGGNDPLSANTLPPRTTPTSTITESPSPTPTADPSLSPVDVEGEPMKPNDKEETRKIESETEIYRDNKYVLGYEIADMQPAPLQVEAYPKEYVDTVIQDTLYVLEAGSLFSGYRNQEISDTKKQMLFSDYSDLTTKHGREQLEKRFDSDAFFLIPHRVPKLLDENGKNIAWDPSRNWEISYTDFTFVTLEDKGKSDPQSVYSIVQEIHIPVEGNKVVVLKVRLYLYMEYGAESWLLDDWMYEMISKETVEQ